MCANYYVNLCIIYCRFVHNLWYAYAKRRSVHEVYFAWMETKLAEALESNPVVVLTDRDRSVKAHFWSSPIFLRIGDT